MLVDMDAEYIETVNQGWCLLPSSHAGTVFVVRNKGQYATSCLRVSRGIFEKNISCSLYLSRNYNNTV